MKKDTPYQESILADHVSRELAEWHVDGLLFTTFQYENDSFNDLILPAFLGEQVRPDKEVVRKVTERLTRTTLPFGCTVFADRRGVWEGEYGATGVIDLIPVNRRSVFHPKVCVALLRSKRLQSDPRKGRAVFLMVSSANLTRAGWQRNVEGVASRILEGHRRVPLVDDLAALLRSLADEDTQDREILSQFLAEYDRIFRDADQAPSARKDRLVVSGYGKTSFTEQLKDALTPVWNRFEQGMELEVISPFTTIEGYGTPLQDLIDTTTPNGVTVMLPLKRSDVSLWSPDHVGHIEDQAGEGFSWGTLSEAILDNPDPDMTHYRNVHAKVYRWRSTTGLPLEVSVIGSHNLTTQAFSGTQNVEVSMVVFDHRSSKGNAEPWLIEISPPEISEIENEPGREDGVDGLEDTLPIRLTYDWAERRLCAKSADDEVHDALLFVGESPIPISVDDEERAVELDAVALHAVEVHLQRRSFVDVQIGDVNQWMYVEQLNLEQKPWLHGELTLEDLIEYLTTEQRKPKDHPEPPTGKSVSDPVDVGEVDVETLQDRMAGLLRVSVKLRERNENAQGVAVHLHLPHLQQQISRYHPLSLWQFVELLMKARGGAFREEEIYLTLASLEQVLGSIKARKAAAADYRAWVKADRDVIKDLIATIRKHRRTLRAHLKERLSGEGVQAAKMLAWLDEEIEKPVKVTDGH